QAEDGIRDRTVTGVQTCALPISRRACVAIGSPSTRSCTSNTASGAAVVLVMWNDARTSSVTSTDAFTLVRSLHAVWTSVQSLPRSEEHTSELQSPYDLVCRLLLEKKKTNKPTTMTTFP